MSMEQTMNIIAFQNKITEQSYLLHHRDRKLPDLLKEPSLEMLATGSKPASMALLMSKKADKVVLAKDLYNLKSRSKIPENDAAQLQVIIDSQIKMDNGKNYFNFMQNEQGDEFYGLFYQNNRMKSLFQTYGAITCIDGTYNINKQHFPCINFVVTDHNRQSRVVAYALLTCERLAIMNIVLQYFKLLNDTDLIR